MKTYYYLYKIINKLNNKIYVGVHKTDNLNDGYMGSGKILNRAIKKYGVENFKKDILIYFDTAEEMFIKEKEIVTDEFLLREDTYNLRRGGSGGFDYINKDIEFRKSKNRKARAATDLILEDKWGSNWRSTLGKLANTKAHTESAKLKRKQTRKNLGIVSNASNMNTPEVNNKKKEKFKEIGHQQGEKNSQAGTMWITNNVENKKIKKTDSIPNGWNKGRVQSTPYMTAEHSHIREGQCSTCPRVLGGLG